MKKRHFLPLAAICLALGGCWGPVGNVPTTMEGKDLTQPQRFTLKDLKGEAVSLDQELSRNKAVLVDFWATWCGYCVEEMPDLIKLQDKYHSRGFTVLAVNVGESREQAAAFAQKMKLNFPVLLDEDNAVAQAYGIVGIPLSLLVDPKGRILAEYHSYSQKMGNDVEKALNE